MRPTHAVGQVYTKINIKLSFLIKSTHNNISTAIV